MSSIARSARHLAATVRKAHPDKRHDAIHALVERGDFAADAIKLRVR